MLRKTRTPTLGLPGGATPWISRRSVVACWATSCCGHSLVHTLLHSVAGRKRHRHRLTTDDRALRSGRLQEGLFARFFFSSKFGCCHCSTYLDSRRSLRVVAVIEIERVQHLSRGDRDWVFLRVKEGEGLLTPTLGGRRLSRILPYPPGPQAVHIGVMEPEDWVSRRPVGILHVAVVAAYEVMYVVVRLKLKVASAIPDA